MKYLELKPIKESDSDFDDVEAAIKALFKREIYFPVLKQLQLSKIKLFQNSRDDLLWGLRTGQVTFNRGVFSGKFNAAITRELKSLGARWESKTGTFRLPSSKIPFELKSAIAASTNKFEEKLRKIDAVLDKMLPEEIAGRLKVSEMFDRTLWKVDREFRHNVKNITVAPQLTKDQASRISKEWESNMQIWIKDFTSDEIRKLREQVKANVFTGNRYGSLIKTIQDSYGVSANKAKFLARQETALLMAKHKQVRYEEVGIDSYRWGCVSGSPLHPVRPWHKILEGKIFKWSDPPITTQPGESVRRNNPGQDYNCRCFARPIVRVKSR